MRIKCQREGLSAEQLAALEKLGLDSAPMRMQYSPEVGREYDALALYLSRGVAWVYFSDEFDRARVAPLCLFDIEDGEVPKSWRVSIQDNGTVVFVAPPEMSDLYFADDVDEKVPAAYAAWQRALAEARRDRKE